MPVWNLPPLDRNAVFPPATDSGSWQLPDSGLRELGASLRTDEDPFNDPHEPIRAVPDPWAQARAFAEALIVGPGHSMYRHALPQWRGLLALYALNSFYGGIYSIRGEQVPLNSERLFDRALRHLTPQIALGDDVGQWQKPAIFTMQNDSDKKLATWLGNPACLVSPGRLTPDHSIKDIPWFKNGLVDPLSCNMPLTQIVALREWLRDLHAELEEYTGRCGDRIRNLVLEYSEECAKLTGQAKFKVTLGASLFAHLDAPFSLLGKGATLVPSSDPAADSNTKIKLDPQLLDSNGGIGRFKGVILVDPALARLPGYDPRQTLVWGTQTLGELLESRDVLLQAKADAARQGWYLISAEDLFTERVAKFGDRASIPGHPPAMSDLLAPVKPLALMLPDGVGNQLEAQSGGGRAVFTLNLQLVDGTGKETAVALVRNYAANPTGDEGQLVVEEDWSVCHTSLWPDFKSSAWSDYYARMTYPESEGKEMVRPERPLSGRMIANELASMENAQASVDRIEEINSGRMLTATRKSWVHSRMDHDRFFDDMHYSAHPFEAICYTDALSKQGEAQAGMAFLALEEKKPTGGPFPVAVDFGTTNTVATAKKGTSVSFEDRVMHPIQYDNPSETSELRFQSRWLLKRFLPADKHSTPCPTVALNRIPHPSQISLHTFRNLIYFHTHEAHPGGADDQELEEFAKVKRAAKFDLKWSEEPDTAEAAQDYLFQFMLMLAAETLAEGRDPRRIKWRFSIPDALDGELRYQFEDTLREVTREISSELTPQDGILAPLYSEGLAAAGYILENAGFVKGSINIVLDIGGGTTDVTIWDVDKLCWKGSFKLAGRDFFTSTISNNPEILQPIGLGHWANLFNAGGATTDEKDDETRDLAEMLFSGPALQEAIDEHWSQLRIKTGKHLRLTSLTFIAGIAWYLGKIVKGLVEDGVLRQDQLSTPAFALCGRGAGIFKKMHAGRDPDSESEVTKALKVFSAAAEIEGTPLPQLFTTQNAKLEVVSGMITDDSSIDMTAVSGNNRADNFTVAGMGFTLSSGDSVEANQRFGRKMLTNDVKEVRLDDFTNMLAALEELGGIKVDPLPNNAQGALKAGSTKVISSINRLRASDDKDKEIEPPFVTALRELVDAMASGSAVRDKRVKADFV